MRKFSFWVLVFVLLVFQVTLFRKIEVWGVRPDAVIVLIVYVALAHGSLAGAVFGFFVCLAEYSIHSSGLASLPLAGVLVGYVVGKYGSKIMYESYLVQAVIVFASVVLFDTVNFVWLGSAGYWSGFFGHTIAAGVYTAFAGVLVVAVMERMGGLRIVV